MRKVIFLLFIKVRAVMYFAQILGRVKLLQITLPDCVQFKIIITGREVKVLHPGNLNWQPAASLL